VFTHLDEEYQDAWLVELERITKPGGMLVLSASGNHVFEEFTQHMRDSGADPTAFCSVLEETGILFVADDGMVESPFPDFYHTTFHTPWYIEHWGRIFEVKAYVVRGDLDYQDLVLLARREQRVGAVRPRSSLPAGLDHEQTRASRLELPLTECEQEKQLWRSTAEAARSDLKSVLNSRSWRLTAPFRKLMSSLRGSKGPRPSSKPQMSGEAADEQRTTRHWP
jgi:hypothetical protein